MPTIVELKAFSTDADRILNEEQRQELHGHLAEQPQAGVIVPGMSGVRKLRWGPGGKGKRGGSRVIYYYHDLDVPLYLIAIFSKSEKSDLDSDEKNIAKQFAESVAKAHRKQRSE